MKFIIGYCIKCKIELWLKLEVKIRAFYEVLSNQYRAGRALDLLGVFHSKYLTFWWRMQQKNIKKILKANF